MRLLMLSWRGPHHPRAGGAEVYTEILLEELVKRGHEVSWYSASHERQMPDTYKGITMHYGSKGMKVYLSGHSFVRKNKNYDIVIDQINTFGFAMPLISKVRVVSLIHQLADDVWDYECKPPISQIGKTLERILLSCYRNTPYITISKSTDDDLRRLAWKNKSQLVTNGVEIGIPREKTSFPSIVFLARYKAQAKRLDHAYKAFLNVQKEFPEAQFWVIGRGEPPEYLRDQLGVRVYNNVSNEERDALLAKSWVCIATSVREGWGRMVLESAANGTPSVVYDVPGLRDAVIDGETGLIVKPTPDDLKQAVTFLFHNTDILETYSRQAFENAKEFTWGKSVDNMEQFFRDILTLS